MNEMNKKKAKKGKLEEWRSRQLTTDTLSHCVKITSGVIASVLIARLAGVEFAASTAIITLLGIQKTKRDTLQVSVLRAVTFVYTILIALQCHRMLGVGIPAFCAAAAIVTLMTEVIGWENTLSINIVIIIHLFIKQEPFTAALILNETERLIIGVGIAVLINLWMPDDRRKFIRSANDLEETMRGLLQKYAGVLRGEGGLEGTGEILDSFLSQIQKSTRRAYLYAGNNFASHADYYIGYMTMRETEYSILKDIGKQLSNFTLVTAESRRIARYLTHIAEAVHIEHPIENTAERLADVKQTIDNAPLPETREVFREQSVLFAVTELLAEMLEVKRDFISSLTEQQRAIYWNR